LARDYSKTKSLVGSREVAVGVVGPVQGSEWVEVERGKRDGLQEEKSFQVHQIAE